MIKLKVHYFKLYLIERQIDLDEIWPQLIKERKTSSWGLVST